MDGDPDALTVRYVNVANLMALISTDSQDVAMWKPVAIDCDLKTDRWTLGVEVGAAREEHVKRKERKKKLKELKTFAEAEEGRRTDCTLAPRIWKAIAEHYKQLKVLGQKPALA